MSSEESERQIILPPGGRFRRQAGPYHLDTGQPRYAFHVCGPDEQACRLVEDHSQIMGVPGNNFYVWDIKNLSTWPVFLTLSVDEVPVDLANH